MTTKAEQKTQGGGVGMSGSWTFFSNHSHVLICLYGRGDLTMREVAERVGITERAVQKIVAELEAAGILSRNRIGRKNSYTVNALAQLRHSIESHRTVGELLQFVLGDPENESEPEQE